MDRFELLYDNINELKDLRRAVIDEDLSSIFRLAQSISDDPEKFEEFRKAIIESNLHSVFRIIDDLDNEHYDEFRKAVLEKNIHAIFRVLEYIENNPKMEMLRKAIINKGESFDVLRLFVDSEVLTTLPKTIRSFPRLNVKDAYARGQLHSKKWLVSEVEKIGMHLGTVFLCAGWYGTLATMLFLSLIHI